MGGRHSRRKGADFEREVARTFRDVLGEARRGIGQARSASEVPDVEVSGWWVEAKHRQRVNVRGALLQATTAEAEARTRGAAPRRPVAVCRDNGKPVIAALHLVDFLDLLARLQALESSTAAGLAALRAYEDALALGGAGSGPEIDAIRARAEQRFAALRAKALEGALPAPAAPTPPAVALAGTTASAEANTGGPDGR